MNTDTLPNPKVHHGRNIKKFRELLNVKQETLAFELDLSQQTISRLENKQIIDDETLNKVALVLGIPVEAIKNMTEESVFNIVANTFNSHDTSIGNQSNYQCTFNPIDKIVELYERMLEMEREKK